MFHANEAFAALVMSARDIGESGGSDAFDCSADRTGRGFIGPPAPGSVLRTLYL